MSKWKPILLCIELQIYSDRPRLKYNEQWTQNKVIIVTEVKKITALKLILILIARTLQFGQWFVYPINLHDLNFTHYRLIVLTIQNKHKNVITFYK